MHCRNKERENLPVLYSCSPRAGGNSDHAVDFMEQGIAEAGGSARIVRLRSHHVHPCIGCHRCRHDPDGRCYLTDLDQSSVLYQPFFHAPFLVFASPIYFYHIPSQFKAFMDRSQCFYMRRQAGDKRLLDLPERPVWVVMFAGRSQGERLFEGALLSLKYFLQTFNFHIQEKFLFRGKDDALDLTQDPEAVQKIMHAGRRAWKEYGE